MNYFVVHSRELRELGLTGTDALVYSALRILTSKGPWKGSLQKLADESLCGGKTTAHRSLSRLIEKGLAKITEDGIILFQNGTVALQNGTNLFQNGTISKERTKENNNIINISMHACLFDDFWVSFSSEGYERSKNRTKRLFESMPSDWQQLAIEKAKNHVSGRDPYWYLKDEDFLRAERSKEVAPAEPKSLSGEEIDACVAAGIPMKVVKYKGRFPVVTEADARRFGLEILRDF